MSKKSDAVASDMMVDIDYSIAPEEMSKYEAVDTLEQIIEECRSRIECLREEIAEEES